MRVLGSVRGLPTSGDRQRPVWSVFSRVAEQFGRSEPREHAQAYIADLLGDRAHTTGGKSPVRLDNASADAKRRLLTTARWDEDAVLSEVRDYLLDRMAHPGVLVIAEHGFVKRGDRSAGVARQYCPGSGRVENCQVGLFLLYAGSDDVTAAIDRELFMPESWFGNDRQDACGCPADAVFRSKGQLAKAMLARSPRALMTARWVVSEQPYGCSTTLRAELEQGRVPYVLPVDADHTRRLLAQARRTGSGPTPAAGDPAAGWRRIALPGPVAPSFERSLLIRADPVTGGAGRCYLCFAPAGTTLIELRSAARSASLSSGFFRAARRDAGLHRYEVRNWRSWYRHMTLALLAHASVVADRPSAAALPAALRATTG
jgi:SRSO17 transposase